MQERISLKVGPDSIGWGILGTGVRAQQMVTQAIRRQPAAPGNRAGAWAVGVYSHNERRARAFAEAAQIPHSFPNVADLLQRHEIQAVYIAGHPRQHYPLAMAALAAGKHVLLETPPALTVKDARTLQQAAEHRGLLLAMSHPLRADPAVQHLQQLLADDFIGDLLGCRILNTTSLAPHLQTWRLQPNGGGVLYQRTYHAIDLLCFLLQDEVATIYATGSQQILGQAPSVPVRSPSANSHPQAVEEEVHSLITLRRHRFTVQLHDAFFIPHLSPIFEIYGSQGTLQLEQWADPTMESKLWFLRSGFSERVDILPDNPDRRMLFAFQQQLHNDYLPSHSSPHRPPHSSGDRPRDNSSPTVLADAQAGVRCLAAITAARQSLWHQRPIALANDLN